MLVPQEAFGWQRKGSYFVFDGAFLYSSLALDCHMMILFV